MKNVPTKKALIKVENVTKSFTTNAGVINVLDTTNFVIEEGSFTIIYGASGSGKSTLLNILMGLDAPTTGKILYDGMDMYNGTPDSMANFRASTRGIVQQSNYWVKSLTVLENVSMALYFSGLGRDEAAKTALEALDQVGMRKYANKLPHFLSGGEQQRVAMARALVHNPTYLLADEPTGNLDSKNGDDIINILRSSNKEANRTIVLVTHNLEYLPLGTKLLLVQDGKVIESTGEDSKSFTTSLLNQMKARIDTWSAPNEGTHHV